jgi:hypothetical protein
MAVCYACSGKPLAPELGRSDAETMMSTVSTVEGFPPGAAQQVPHRFAVRNDKL